MLREWRNGHKILILWPTAGKRQALTWVTQGICSNTVDKVDHSDKALIWFHIGLAVHCDIYGKSYYWICGMYLLCSPAASGPVPGCYRLRLAVAGPGLPGWTVEVQLANPQPLLLKHPASPTLSLASATLCQSHCLEGGDKQVENHSNSIDRYRGKENTELSPRTQLGLKCHVFLVQEWNVFK